jgi:hypothetical protein
MFIPDPDIFPYRIPDLGSRIPDLGSRIPDLGSRIPDLGSRIPDLGSRILDPGSKNSNGKTRVEKKFVVIPFFGAINFTKFNYFNFEMLNKKIWANFQRIIELFTQKLSLSSQKYGFGIWDLRSGNRKKPTPDPRSRIQGSKRHRIPDPDSQHCIFCIGTVPSKRMDRVLPPSPQQRLMPPSRNTC